jgi:hypothetical protein
MMARTVSGYRPMSATAPLPRSLRHRGSPWTPAALAVLGTAVLVVLARRAPPAPSAAPVPTTAPAVPPPPAPGGSQSPTLLRQNAVTTGTLGLVTVTAGTTLWALAQNLYGTPLWWPALYCANSSSIANPNVIYPGQQLSVPDRATAQRLAQQYYQTGRCFGG